MISRSDICDAINLNEGRGEKLFLLYYFALVFGLAHSYTSVTRLLSMLRAGSCCSAQVDALARVNIKQVDHPWERLR